jgi:2-dehydro-3-deoxyphosphogluconate aldolase/(4S)-4-hydroxy-2-oxoglutarate aldolase
MHALQTVLAEKIVAIVRLDDYVSAVDVARALEAGGIRVLEFTLTGTGAIEAIAATRLALGDTVCVGAGTVLSAADAHATIAAGAQFVVTPALRPAVIKACVSHNVLAVCGGFTPTELLQAHECGAQLIKVFPAQAAGARYLSDVLAPLPFLKLVPTGGISALNAHEYFAAGAVAVGLGGSLVSRKAVAARAFGEITAAATQCRAAIS